MAQFQAFVAEQGHRPADERCLRGLPNHPVVYVDWSDALAYCDWLTTCLRAWPKTPEPLARLLREPGGRVVLPSEAEWEKAARGPDGFRYPWGNDLDLNSANYIDTGIGTTSAVGCFPGGASVYGVEELSGTVWEWTRSIFGEYPYPTDEKERAQREDLQERERPRVLRGGSFIDGARLIRCALRHGFHARGANDYAGFRVALAVLPYSDL